MSAFKKLSYTINRLGILRSKIGDLQGLEILAGELIQNADDAPSVTELVFDVTSRGLGVENNGSFREVDFERIQDIGRGGKREEEGTTGAFGIGFISVYQVTDQPEIHSAGRHWILNPVEEISARDEVDDGRTRFFLPWATNPDSEVRRGLGLQNVDGETIVAELHEVFSKALPSAMLFLKNIQTIELKREGVLSFRWTREVEQSLLLIHENGDHTVQEWYLFQSDFQTEAQKLREEHPGVENKRKSIVTIAIPKASTEVQGVLCATLPTQSSSGLPMMVNADFYPSSDRKRILFDSDYKSDWNRAALEAVARALGESLTQLPHLLGAPSLWALLSAAQSGEKDPVLGVYWRVLAPRIPHEAVVLTTQNEWKTPSSTFWLEKEEEHKSEPLFAALALPIVHRDLRPYQNLLRQLKVPLLGATHLARSLEDAGLDKPLFPHELPSWFTDDALREQLNLEVSAVRNRSLLTTSQKEEANQALASCTLVHSLDGVWRAPANVYSCAATTSDLFAPLIGQELFLNDATPDALVSLCDSFDLRSAVSELQCLEPGEFASWSESYPGAVARLVAWFADRKAELRADPSARKALKGCPIWPSGGNYRPLDELWVTGDFKDPLKLASLLDLEMLPGHGDFLLDMGARKLTFIEYARKQVPEALMRGSLSSQEKRDVVVLLSHHLGELRGEADIQKILGEYDLAECLDGQFRKVSEAYLDWEIIRDVLSPQVPLCRLPIADNHRESVRELLKWLGVQTEPAPRDVVKRLNEITQLPPSGQSRRNIQKFFEYLRSIASLNGYEGLRTMAWLPVENDETKWFKAAEVYAIYQRNLFHSQALFLDLKEQNRRDSSDFIEWLGVKTTPEVQKVIAHLRECSTKSDKRMSREVYTFLQQNLKTSRNIIEPLKFEPVLLCGDGNYRSPDSVFWGIHEFGEFRTQIGDDFRPLTELLKVWGVKDQPDATDASALLLEISAQLGPANARLEDEVYRVVLVCWTMLSRDLAVFEQAEMPTLESRRVVPNAQRILDAPQKTFFEDRPGLRDKFQLLQNQVIARPQEAWRAMEKAGVRNLSEVALPVLTRCDSPVVSSEVMERLTERQKLMRSVFDVSHPNSAQTWNFDALAQILVHSTEYLEVAFRVNLYGREEICPPDAEDAFYDGETRTLYVVPCGNDWPWAAISRELVHALNPQAEATAFSSLIKDVLSPSSLKLAARELRVLGHVDVEEITVVAQVAAPAVGLGGEGEAPDVSETTLSGTHSAAIPQEIATLPMGATSLANSHTSSDNELRTNSTFESWSGTSPSLSNGTASPDGRTSSLSGGEKERGFPNGNSHPRPPSETASPLRGNHTNDGTKSASSSQGRLGSYVTPKDGVPSVSTPESQAQEQHRTAVDEAGIAHVLAYETACGRNATDKNKEKDNNIGYDILASDPSARTLRYIEVKSLSGLLSERGVGLSSKQFETAQQYGDNYWLYIVQRVESEEFNADTDLLRIQNPAGKVDTFFFDSGWRYIADNALETESKESPK